MKNNSAHLSHLILKMHFRLYSLVLVSSFFYGTCLDFFFFFLSLLWQDRPILICFVLFLKFAHVEHLDVVASKSVDTASQ